MKIIPVLAILAIISVGAFPYTNGSGSFVNASGSTSDSVVIPSATHAPGSGSRIVIDTITAYGDVSTCFVKILKADTTGVTDNFTEIWRGDLGDATVTYPKAGVVGPLLVGDANTQYKVEVSTTTAANSALVSYRTATLGEAL